MNDKEKITARLEGKDYLIDLIEKYGEIEEKIIDELSQKEMWTDMCKCDTKDGIKTFKFIHEGDFDEVVCMCIKCGGCFESQAKSN